VCEILGVKAGVLFGEVGSGDDPIKGSEGDKHDEVASSRKASRNDDQLIAILKAHIKDKDRIIELLSGGDRAGHSLVKRANKHSIR
jgi:hypothetical protein